MSLDKDKVVQLYQSVSESEKKRVYEHWHASSLAQCPRSQYFQRLGVEPLRKASGAKILRWQTGHLMEQAIRPHVEKLWGNGTKVKANGRTTSDKWDLTGEFDNHAAAAQTLIEIKTVHDYAFIDRNGDTTLKQATGKLNKWKRPEYEPKLTPYLHHAIQNHSYVLLLEEVGVEIKNIDYVYMSLSGRIAVYHTEVNPKLLERVKVRLNLLNDAWKTQTPPDCLCQEVNELYGGVYRWCDYRPSEPGDTPDPDCCSLDLLKEVK